MSGACVNLSALSLSGDECAATVCRLCDGAELRSENVVRLHGCVVPLRAPVPCEGPRVDLWDLDGTQLSEKAPWTRPTRI